MVVWTCSICKNIVYETPEGYDCERIQPLYDDEVDGYCNKCHPDYDQIVEIYFCKQCNKVIFPTNETTGCSSLTCDSCEHVVICTDCNPTIDMIKDVSMCIKCIKKSLNDEGYDIVNKS
jgi:hypothetical protein